MFRVSILTPANLSHPGLATAGARAGATVFLDLEFCRPGDRPRIEANLRQVLEQSPAEAVVGLRLTVAQAQLAPPLLEMLGARHHVLWLAGDDVSFVRELAPSESRELYREILEVSRLESLSAEGLEYAGLVAKGHEAGGRIGEWSAFILTQQVLSRTGLPVHVQGGVGPHSAAACLAAGAAGVVLDDQLWLMPESPLPPSWKSTLKPLNGSETVVLGERLGTAVRVLSRPGFSAVETLRSAADELELSGREDGWKERLSSVLGWGAPAEFAWPVGQAVGLAAEFARTYQTTGRLVCAIRNEAEASLRTAAVLEPLAPDSLMARSHGTRYPIVQGPMTRVSDTAPFAHAVAKAGGLPMLALAMLRGPQVDKLLRECKALMDGMSWGVGILGFVPPELREEQLQVVREVRPPFALIAGGRPEQAARLEKEGIATYLHVPTPQLLELFLERGSRRFVFEGRECGGHIGPLTSFCLWEAMIRRLLRTPDRTAGEVHVLFAGGIHDARSAAMISALAAPLAAKGMKIGVLMGTAYLFTHEAVDCGAIVPKFQQEALSCKRTINLETGPGHAIRCVATPFADEFYRTRRELVKAGREKQAITRELDELTIGRLRVASKGLKRVGDKVVPVAESVQYGEGMYMIGQAASLRDGLVRIGDLHADVSEGAGRLVADAAEDLPATPAAPPKPSDIAIIGISVLLPGAHNTEEYWTNILRKTNSITEIPAHRWDWRLYYDPDKNAPDKIYSKWGGFLDEIPFNPLEFGIPPNSLKSIEPLQLLALEATRRALVDAGYENGGFNRERASVIFGVGGGLADLGQQFAARSEIPRILGPVGKDAMDRLPEWTGETFPGLLFNIVTGRVANRFDFGGSNYIVDAACASSLAAIDQAVRELETGTCDLAFAGGVDTMQSPYSYICFSKTQALSPRGVSSAFDESADGIVLSEGVGVLVLKRLADAERDGDRIYAVIRATASSSDGRGASMTAPTSEGQLRAMRRAYAKAGISPATIGLYEAHGTGTAVGDRVELESFTALLRENAAEEKSCVVGSVKTLIGHTKSTAGVASMAKAALALYHKVLPAHAGVENPLAPLRNPETPVCLVEEAAPWFAHPAHPRRAAVSAFGFGGTNSHAILEEYQGGLKEPPCGGEVWPCELFVWRAADRDALAKEVGAFLGKLPQWEKSPLREIACHNSRRAHPAGGAALAVVAESVPELTKALETALRAIREPGSLRLPAHIVLRLDNPPTRSGKVAFLFPGQGAQYPHAARETALYISELAGAIEAADVAFEGAFAKRFSHYLYPPRAFTPEARQQAVEALSDTRVAQPAIGVISCGYLDFLERIGLSADMMAGHSYGEYTALHAAGVLSRDEFLRLSLIRGRTMAEACEKAPGAMAAVLAAREDVQRHLEGSGVIVANHNSPRQTVISGGRDRIAAVLRKLDGVGLSYKELPVSGAFHSPAMNDAQEPLARAIAEAVLRQPARTVFSNVTAGPYEPAPEAIRRQLTGHLLSPVEFVRQIEAMYDAGARVFVEVGPRTILSSLTADILKGRPGVTTVALDSARGSLKGLLQALAVLFVEGVEFDPAALLADRVALDFTGQPGENSSQGKEPAHGWRLSGGCVRTLRETQGTFGKRAPLTADDVASSPPALGQKPISPSMSTSSETPDRSVQPSVPVAPQAQVVSLHAYAAYQETMRQFLRMQEEVMKQFLGGAASAASATAPSVPVTLPAIPAVPAVAAPTAPAPVPAPVPPAASAPAPAAAVHAPAEAPASAPAPSASADGETLSREGLTANLVNLVSERTGYPADMLGLEQDVEADLGIDSIKRVEIFGAFQNQLPPQVVARLSEHSEDLTRIRTLKGWIDAVMESAA
jgi:acyl transferase domain-containing protein/NAD(P)H-dependent flavin oxidoreductase YrpB (nitropropane dioxygenase family)